MTTRTSQTVVRFSSAFLLPGIDTPQPAGDYRVDRDEELIEGLSWLAWRRVGTFIHLPGIGQQGATHRLVPINPADLDAGCQEGVTIQDSLEPVRLSHAGDDATLIERTLGHGQGAKTRQSRVQEAETGKGSTQA